MCEINGIYFPTKIETFIQNIFSIKKENECKSIHILGYKFKIRMNRLPVLNYLETHIVHHCNLNCKACTHFCNLVDEKFVDLETFKNDLTELSKKIRINHLKLMGGEPLLNKDIELFIKAAREIFPYTCIHLITNGLLLGKMPQSFWKTCKDADIVMDISKYPASGRAFSDYLDLIDEHNIKLGNIHVANKFWLIHNPKGNSDIKRAYNCCSENFCHQLRESQVFVCPKDCYLDFYNDYFKTNIPSNHGLDIYKHSGKEIIKFLKKPVETCKWCSYEKVDTNWEVSKRLPNEWDAVCISEEKE